jgi:hypothetical protein
MFSMWKLTLGYGSLERIERKRMINEQATHLCVDNGIVPLMRVCSNTVMGKDQELCNCKDGWDILNA